MGIAKTRILQLAFCALLAAWASLAYADGGVIGAYARFGIPLGKTDVQMVSERVEARMTGRDVTVDCTYYFHNPGPTQTVVIGFPQQVQEGAISNFQSWVNGKPLKVRRVRGDKLHTTPRLHELYDIDTWFVKRITFKHGVTRLVRDHYRAAYGEYPNEHPFYYNLWTGATWSGVIRKIVVVVDTSAIPKEMEITADPHSYRKEGQRYIWEFHNIKPSEAFHKNAPEEISLNWGRPTITINSDGPEYLVRDYMKDGTVVLPLSGRDNNGIALDIFLMYLPDTTSLQVHWDHAAKTATLKWPDKEIALHVGSRIAYINGKELPLSVAPFIRKGRIWFPPAPLVRAQGGIAYWDASSRNLTISWATRNVVDAKAMSELGAQEELGKAQKVKGGKDILQAAFKYDFAYPYYAYAIRYEIIIEPHVPACTMEYREFPYRIDVTFKSPPTGMENISLPEWTRSFFTQLFPKLNLTSTGPNMLLLFDGPALAKFDAGANVLLIEAMPDTSKQSPNQVYAVRGGIFPVGDARIDAEREKLIKAGVSADWLYALPTNDGKFGVLEAGAFPDLASAQARAASLKEKGIETKIVTRKATALPTEEDLGSR